MTSMKEMRSYLRAQGKKLEAFRDLDAKLGELGDLDKAIVKLADERKHAEAGLRQMKNHVERIAAEADEIMTVAKDEKERLSQDAKKIIKDAKSFAATKNKIVADAKEEAIRICLEGSRVAEETVNGITGALKDINQDVTEAKKQRTTLSNDIAARDKRKQQLETAIDELVRKFG